MKFLYSIIILIVTLKSITSAANPDVTEYQDVNIKGSFFVGSVTTEEFILVGADITYTTSTGSSTSTDRTVSVSIARESELGAAFTQSTGLTEGNIISVSYKSEWTVTSVSNLDDSSPISSDGYANNAPRSPWSFSDWIVGPPPTDEKEGVEVVDTYQATSKLRYITRTQKYKWSLSWKEEKPCE